MRQSSVSLFAVDGARLDDLDLEILRLLQIDGRTPNAVLARAIDLSPSATLQRVRRLEATGAIQRYVAEADETLFGAWSCMIIEVTLSGEGQRRRREFETNVSGERKIIEAAELAGAPDYLLRAAVPSAAHWPMLRDAIDPSGALMLATRVSLVVRQTKSRKPHPLLYTRANSSDLL